MLCSRCHQREAAFEHFHVGSYSGPLCQQCAVELGAQFLKEREVDCGEHPSTQVAQGLQDRAAQLLERLKSLMQQDPLTKDRQEIVRRLREYTSDSDSPAA